MEGEGRINFCYRHCRQTDDSSSAKCALCRALTWGSDWWKERSNGDVKSFFVCQREKRPEYPILDWDHIDCLNCLYLFVPRLELEDRFNMFGNIVPMSNVGTSQVLSGNVLSNNNVGNNDLVIIQDTGSATSQAELINQLQNHITENQQILIITDDQGQDQCKFVRFFCSFCNPSFFSDVIIDKDQDINALLQDGECFSVSQFKDDDS